MSKPKVVMIGAGSVIFGMNCIKDAFAAKSLWGSELIFVDIDEAAVNIG
jgi:alpha-galactosidase/6-phospho-beta-glucosidase family protein